MGNGKRVTIDDLSAAAGVSRSTVSRVVSGRGYVGAAVRDRVMEAIRALGYRPTRKHRGKSVRDLVMISTGLLASPVQIQLIQSIIPAIEASGLKAMVSYNQFSPFRLQEYLLYARDRQFAGIIFLGMIEAPEILSLLRAIEIPMVLLNQRIRGIAADLIMLDDFRGGYAAAEILLRAGHRRIGLLMGHAKAGAAKDREKGYRQALRDAGIPVKKGDVRYGDFTERTGMEYARELLGNDRGITAVISCNDLMTAGLALELTRAGRRIPEDFSIVGFDDTFITDLADVELTTVDYDFGAVGNTAAEFIVSRLEDPYQEPKERMFQPIVRERARAGASGRRRGTRLIDPCVFP